MRSPLHIGLIVETRYLAQLQPLGLASALERAGHSVTTIDPGADAARLDVEQTLAGFDVVAARGRSWPVLCVLELAEARGIPTINPRASIAAVHNKADMAVRLAAAGIPTPATFVGAPAPLARACRDACAFPVVVKPVFGDNGAGLRVVRTARELAALAPAEPLLAQALVMGRGREMKVYGIGSDVWTVRRPAMFAPVQARRTAHPERQPATPAYRRLAEQCARLFGLDAFGIDCIETDAGPVVIEVNEFPNYRGIEEASERLADLVVRRANTGLGWRRTSCASGF